MAENKVIRQLQESHKSLMAKLPGFEECKSLDISELSDYKKLQAYMSKFDDKYDSFLADSRYSAIVRSMDLIARNIKGELDSEFRRRHGVHIGYGGE